MNDLNVQKKHVNIVKELLTLQGWKDPNCPGSHCQDSDRCLDQPLGQGGARGGGGAGGHPRGRSASAGPGARAGSRAGSRASSAVRQQPQPTSEGSVFKKIYDSTVGFIETRRLKVQPTLTEHILMAFVMECHALAHGYKTLEYMALHKTPQSAFLDKANAMFPQKGSDVVKSHEHVNEQESKYNYKYIMATAELKKAGNFWEDSLAPSHLMALVVEKDQSGFPAIGMAAYIQSHPTRATESITMVEEMFPRLRTTIQMTHREPGGFTPKTPQPPRGDRGLWPYGPIPALRHDEPPSIRPPPAPMGPPGGGYYAKPQGRNIFQPAPRMGEAVTGGVGLDTEGVPAEYRV